MESQNKQILADLLTGCKITAMDALARYGCARLASRINQIKNMGFDVKSEMIEVPTRSGRGAKVAQYFIESKVEPKVKFDSIGQVVLFV